LLRFYTQGFFSISSICTFYINFAAGTTQFYMNSTSHQLKIDDGKRLINLEKPVVMGILNITPDSFYDGGKHNTEKQILKTVDQMISEGAAMIDVGAVSTRPEAPEITKDEELQRLIPVVQLLSKRFPEIVLSIDTFRSAVAIEAIAAGGHIINDISGGNLDSLMFNSIAQLRVPYILMHMQGTPATMQKNPMYEDVVNEVLAFFRTQINKLATKGVKDNIVIDPGFGFGKTVEHNFQILKSLKRITELGYPVLTGISRKSMINRILKTRPENALNGTTALNVIALLNGASILRVHDVKQAIEAIKLVEFYQST